MSAQEPSDAARQPTRDAHADRYALAAVAARVGVWDLDLRTNDLVLAPELKAMLGYTDAELPDTLDAWCALVHPDDRDKTIAATRDHLDGKTPIYQAEVRRRHRDGTYRWFLARGRALRDDRGVPYRMTGSDTDITEQKRAELALRESEERFRTLADSAPVLIWMSDEQKAGVYFNRPWLAFTGRPLEQELGNGWLGSIHPEDADRAARICGGAFARREPFTLRVRMRRHDGEYRWLLDTGVPRWRPDGTLAGFVGSCIDITDQLHTQQELADAYASLQERNAQLRLALDSAAMGEWEWSPQTNEIRHSDQVPRIFDLPPGARLTMEAYRAAVHPEDEPVVAAAFRRATEARDVFECEFRVIRPNGQIRWASVRGRGFYDGPGGALTRFVGVAADVTDRKRDEVALVESEQQLRMALDAGRMGTWQYAIGTGRVVWSPALELLHGLEPGGFAGTFQAFLDDVHPDDRERVGRQIAETIEHRRDHHIEYRLLLSDGTIKWVEGRGRLFLDENGAPDRMVGVCVDVTARKQAEEVQARLAAIVEGSEDAIVGQDLEGTILAWNKGAEKLFGYPAHETLGRHVSLLAPPDRPDEMPRILAAVRRGEHVEHFETVRVARDGRRVQVSLAVSPIRDGEGRVIGVSKVARDISQQKRVERALRESEERFRTLTDTAPQIVWSASPSGQVEYFNEWWYRYTGQEATAGLGRGWCDVLHPDDRERTLARWDLSLRSGEPYEIEYRFRSNGGGYRWFLGRALPIRDDAGRIVRWFGTCTDIDDHKRAEAELQKAKDDAEAANAAKDQFLAALSHELRTPLTPALALLPTLVDDPRLPADVRDELAMIRRNVELEARLIDDLLDLTRISKGKLRLNLEPVDLHAVVRSAVDICRPEVSAKRLTLSVDLSARRHVVRGDAARLQQVVWNLIKNAVKFTPEGGSVLVRCTDEDPDPAGNPAPSGAALALLPPSLPAPLPAPSITPSPGTVRLSVEDTGIGIEPHLLPQIFDAFVQGQRSHRFGGLGLGLAISRALVELHDGQLIAESEGRGRGTRMTVRLPAMNAASDESAAPGAVGGPPADGKVPGRALRILLVEDHADTARVMAQLLRGSQYVVATANSVADALKAADQGEFDLVISDLGLPDGSGLELMRQLRERRPIKGIALSGFGTEEDVRRSREAGFVDHLTKPISFQTLRNLIEQAAS